MNLSAKIKSFGALLLGLLFFISCEELGSFGLGEEDIAPLEFFTTDLKATGGIVLIDSIISRGTGTILVGERNESFGQMNAKAYSAFFLELNDLLRPFDDAILDSVKLNMNFNYKFEDTGLNQRINLKAYQVLKIFPDITYVTSSFLPVTDELIAEGEILIDELDSTFSLSVDADWANEVFEGLKDEDDPRFNDSDEFARWFPGLMFTSEDPVNNIFGFVPGESLEFRFYFSEPASDGSGLIENREIAITGDGSPHFYSLDVDRTNTQYSQVQDPEVEYPVQSDLLVHSGAGIVSKINLGELSDFAENNEGVIVNLVELTVGPINDLGSGVEPPESLLLYFTDDQNTLILDNNNIRGIQQDGVNVLSSTFPVRIIYDEETKSYTSSITSYVQNYYNDIFRRDFVFMYPSDMNSSANAFELSPDLINIKIFYSELR